MTLAKTVARAAALALPLALCAALLSSSGAAADEPQPVVVELFTSEGCSSCPPADALLLELAKRPDIYALSLHVDYWDYIGWRDRFASPAMTERQRQYAQRLRLPYVYTPQMVIDGRDQAVGANRAQVLAAIAAAASRGKPLTLRYLPENGGKVLIPAGSAPAGGAVVWMAFYDRSQETPVLRGENAGRTLRHGYVVRRLQAIGTWHGEALEIAVDLGEEMTAGRDGCVVMVQAGGTGPILGALRLATGG